MSARCLEVVHRKSTRGLVPSDHTACAGSADATNMLPKVLTTQSATVSHVFFSQTLVAIKVAINTERGIACNASTRAHRLDSASTSGLLVSTPSPLSYPILRRFRHSRYFAICNAFANPSAVFACGSLTTVNFLSSYFARSHKSLVSMCLRGPHSCRWMMPRAAVESELDRHSQEVQESSEVQCLCCRHDRSVALALSAR